MPELPEVETVRRTLAPAIGARITTAWDSGMGLHMKRAPPRAKLKKLGKGYLENRRTPGGTRVVLRITESTAAPKKKSGKA